MINQCHKFPDSKGYEIKAGYNDIVHGQCTNWKSLLKHVRNENYYVDELKDLCNANAC